MSLSPQDIDQLKPHVITTYNGWQIAKLKRNLYAWKGRFGEKGIVRAVTSWGLIKRMREAEAKKPLEEVTRLQGFFRWRDIIPMEIIPTRKEENHGRMRNPPDRTTR